MLKKETFIKAIELLCKQEQVNESITSALDKVCEGNGFFYDGGRYYLKGLLLVLKETMGDDDNWIEWWLYENGRDAWDENNTKIPLNTVEELYDFLAKETEKKEN